MLFYTDRRGTAERAIAEKEWLDELDLRRAYTRLVVDESFDQSPVIPNNAGGRRSCHSCPPHRG